MLHKECIQGYFDVLKTEIAEFSVLDDIVLIGNLNSHTGDLRENYALIDENNNQDIVETICFITAGDNTVSNDLPSCVNEDITINTFGRKLMNLINETHLIIVNGRKVRDYTGRKTCYTYNGSSTVDYCIVSSQLFCNILRLNVLDQDWFSDHCPITTALKINNIINPPKNKGNKITDFKYIWNEEANKEFNKNTPTQKEAAEKLTKIIIDIADTSLTKKYISNNNININHKSNKITDGIEEKLHFPETKRNFNVKTQQYFQDKNDINRRQEFINARSKYMKLKYLLLRSKKENRLHELAKIESKNPKINWNIVKKITNKIFKGIPMISSLSWINYFQQLINIKPSKTNTFIEYIQSSLHVIEKEAMYNGALDYEITL